VRAHRPLGHPQARADRLVRQAQRELLEHGLLACGQRDTLAPIAGVRGQQTERLIAQVIGHEAVPVQHLADRGGDRLAVGGFGDVTVRTGLERRDRRTDAFVARQHHDRHPGQGAAQLFERLDPVCIGQSQVQQHQAEFGSAAGQLHGLGDRPGAERLRLRKLARQQEQQPVPEQRMVIDDEDPHRTPRVAEKSHVFMYVCKTPACRYVITPR